MLSFFQNCVNFEQGRKGIFSSKLNCWLGKRKFFDFEKTGFFLLQFDQYFFVWAKRALEQVTVDQEVSTPAQFRLQNIVMDFAFDALFHDLDANGDEQLDLKEFQQLYKVSLF